MPRIYLVRHAKPAAAWGDDPDPGLDALGATQAAAAAQQLAGIDNAHAGIYEPVAPLPRDGAAACASCGIAQPAVLPSVAEIPSPPLDREARREWLTAGDARHVA